MENTITSPSGLEGFININTIESTTVTDRSIFLIDGTLQELEEDRICPKCGVRMHIHDTYNISLGYIPFGKILSAVRFEKHRYICPKCNFTCMQEITELLALFILLQWTYLNWGLLTKLSPSLQGLARTPSRK